VNSFTRLTRRSAPARLMPCLILFLASGAAWAADEVPDLSGTWSDPPASAEDAFCHVGCPSAARDYLTNLLDDPDNLDRSYQELAQQAQRYARGELVPGFLTPEALENYPFDHSTDRSLVECRPWGFPRQVFAPHAMEIEQFDDRVTIYYSEWTARRTIYLDGREPPQGLAPSILGYSVGRYDGDTLVVETSAISPDFSIWSFETTDHLTGIERYSKSADGSRLEIEVTLSDPPTLREPVLMRRAWTWAPGEEIYPYECELSDG